MVKTISLTHCLIDNLKIGHTNMVLDCIQPNLQDVKSGHIKARLLMGTYMFLSTEYKFNSSEVDPKCPLCRRKSEDLQHFILRCPALAETRDRYFSPIRKLVIDVVGQSKKKCKDQESIQSSTTPDPGYQWESDNFTIRHNKGDPKGDHSASIRHFCNRYILY